MKIIVLSLILVATGLVSCKRYTCECKFTSTGDTYKIIEFEKSKKRAIEECDNEEFDDVQCEVK